MTKEEIIQLALDFITKQRGKRSKLEFIAKLEFVPKGGGSFEKASSDFWRVTYVDAERTMDPADTCVLIYPQLNKVEFEMSL